MKTARQLRLLTEFRSLEFAPLGSGESRVDRDLGIVRGVKVVGIHSINKHGVANVSGTDYDPQALVNALPMYEGAKVNCDHPERDPATNKPLKKDRTVTSRLGKLERCRIEGGEIFADLRMLKSHPMFDRVMEAADTDGMADLFALSHNAWGRGEVRNGRYVITEIPEVRSVDLVADGGTNRSLFESHRGYTMKLRDLLESKPELKKKYNGLTSLWEGAMDMDVGEGDYRDHLHAARKMCEDCGDMDTAKKIHGLMAPKAVEEDEEEETPTDPEPSDRKTTNDVDTGGDKDKKKQDAMESRLYELERRDACRELCESQQFSPTKIQLKALMALDGVDRTGLLKEFKAGTARRPQSRSLHHEAAEPVTESAVPKDLDGQLNYLRG